MISVITVSYNAEKFIEETLRSILSQKEDNFELIIVDGLSKDNTINIAKQIIKEYKFSETRYKIVSEKDSGIYDAMNKGVKLAKGDYIIFMNCGDSFNNPNVLSTLEVFSQKNDADAIYGDTCIQFYEGTGLYRGAKGNGDNIMPFSHQSIIVKREHLINHPFDTSYKILADREFFTWMRKMGFTFAHCDVIVSNYDAREGLSENNPLRMAFERDRITGKANNKFYFIRKFILTCTIGLIQPIKRLCPRWILNIYFRKKRKFIQWI